MLFDYSVFVIPLIERAGVAAALHKTVDFVFIEVHQADIILGFLIIVIMNTIVANHIDAFLPGIISWYSALSTPS